MRLGAGPDLRTKKGRGVLKTIAPRFGATTVVEIIKIAVAGRARVGRNVLARRAPNDVFEIVQLDEIVGLTAQARPRS